MIDARPTARRAACSRRSGMARAMTSGTARLSGRTTGCSICRRPALRPCTRSTTPALRSRRCGRPALAGRRRRRSRPDAKRDWPARMQRLGRAARPWHHPGAEVWLDGGHNPAGAVRCRRRSPDWRSGCRVRWCWSPACCDKRCGGFLRAFRRHRPLCIRRFAAGRGVAGRLARSSLPQGVQRLTARKRGLLDALSRGKKLDLAAPPRDSMPGSSTLRAECCRSNSETPPV